MPDDFDGYAKLVQATAIPIAAGELLQARFEFAEFMDRGNMHVVQARCRARRRNHRGCTSCQDGSGARQPDRAAFLKGGIVIAPSTHLATVSPNCTHFGFLSAVASESAIRRDLVENDPVPVSGSMPVPGLPGLGIKPHMPAFERFASFPSRDGLLEKVLTMALRRAAVQDG